MKIRGTAIVVKEGLEQINNIDFNMFVDILREGCGYKTIDEMSREFTHTSWGTFVKNPISWFLIADPDAQLAFTEKLMQLREQSKTKQG